MTTKLNAFNPRRESPAVESIPRKPYDTYTFRRPRAISKVKRNGARSSSPSIGAKAGAGAVGVGQIVGIGAKAQVSICSRLGDYREPARL